MSNLSNVSYMDSATPSGTAAVVGRFTKFDGTLPASGDRCKGVWQMPNAVGVLTPVACDGIIPCESGAAFAEGTALQVDATGRLITKAAGVQVAVAWEAATGAGQTVRAWVDQF
jgi:Uncharacterized conserved protein (DUF2190)